MQPTENMKNWLDKLLSDEIIDAWGAAKNEGVWADGSPDEETRELHLANAREQSAYADWLEGIKDNIQFM